MNKNLAVWLGATLFIVSCGKSPPDESPPTPDPIAPVNPDEPNPPVTDTLPPPSDVRIDIGNEHLVVFWPPVESAESYFVYLGTPADQDFPAGAQKITSQDSHALLSGLTNDQAYRVAVAAVKDSTAGAPSEVHSATPVSGLNDTGIKGCLEEGSAQIPCDQAEANGQDGTLGRDATAAGALAKTGGGEGGFDFSWLNDAGDRLEPNDQAQCIVDNHTGLVWELKKEQGLHDAANRYTWYAQNAAQESWQGVQNGGTCIGSDCDTQAFVQAVNEAGLCGFSNWRLPTSEELTSIASIGKTNPTLDTEYFAQAPDTWHWTSEVFLPDTSLAWAVGQQFGHSYPQGKDSAYALRLVRSDTVAEPTDECTTEHWHLNGALATDLETGLTWQRCSLGQQWGGSDCSAQAESLSWWQALEFDVSSLPPSGLGGDYDQGWRLPNAKELASLASRSCAQVLNTDAFPSNPTGRYWTSSYFSDYPQASWAVDFSSGALHDSAQSNQHHVRLVRGQPSLTNQLGSESAE